MMAGASYIEMMVMFGVSRAVVYHLFHLAVENMIKVLNMDGITLTEENRESVSMALT